MIRLQADMETHREDGESIRAMPYVSFDPSVAVNGEGLTVEGTCGYALVIYETDMDITTTWSAQRP